uniref:Uncharacterized protein n=1 Tax=Arundo donax TaxID=35708 RepID=A0A0A9EU34_ARUDO
MACQRRARVLSVPRLLWFARCNSWQPFCVAA